MRVPTRTQLVDGPTKSFTGAFLKNSPTSGIAQLHGGDTTALRQKQLTGIRTSEGCEWILSRKIGGKEDTTQESPAEDPSLSTVFSQPDYLQPPTVPSQSTYHFPIGLW